MTEATQLFIVLSILISFIVGSHIHSKKDYHMPLAMFDTSKFKKATKKKTKLDMDKKELETEA